jgi:hypothetical protein
MLAIEVSNIIMVNMRLQLFTRAIVFSPFLQTKRRLVLKRAFPAFILLLFSLITLLNCFHNHSTIDILTPDIIKHLSNDISQSIPVHKPHHEDTCAACASYAINGLPAVAAHGLSRNLENGRPDIFFLKQTPLTKTSSSINKERAPPAA